MMAHRVADQPPEGRTKPQGRTKPKRLPYLLSRKQKHHNLLSNHLMKRLFIHHPVEHHPLARHLWQDKPWSRRPCQHDNLSRRRHLQLPHAAGPYLLIHLLIHRHGQLHLLKEEPWSRHPMRLGTTAHHHLRHVPQG